MGLPVKTTREKMILRWLKSYSEDGKYLSDAELNEKMEALDELMTEAYADASEDLMFQMMQEKTWGTHKGMQTYNTACLNIWHEVIDQYLPTPEMYDLPDD